MEKTESNKSVHCFPYKVGDIEKSLKVLSDILFVKIVLADEGEIKEIHVVTKESANPKKITRDIESFLLAKYNIQIDYRKISIAQVKEGEMQGEGLAPEEDAEFSPRLKFSNIKLSTIGNCLEVLVQLEANKRVYEGKILGKNWGQNQEYLVAKAALEGISSYLEGSIFFQVEEIKKINLGNKELAVVSIILINSQGKENLVGSAVVSNNDFNKAVIKAILQATNRRISLKSN